jgi:hypothetical protein
MDIDRDNRGRLRPERASSRRATRVIQKGNYSIRTYSPSGKRPAIQELHAR